MSGLAHVILHVALCAAAAHEQGDSVPMHVQMFYHVGGAAFDKTIMATRDERGLATAEFDIDRGLYKLVLTEPKAGCSATDFLNFMADHTRTIAETLTPGPPPEALPVTLFEGSAPQSFLYVKPTFVVFDKSLTCDQPVGTPLDVKVVTEYDPQGFYVWMYQDPALDDVGEPSSRLACAPPTGLYHYLRLPIQFPIPWGGWPPSERIDFGEDDVTGLATMKTGVLLCPKIFETSSG